MKILLFSDFHDAVDLLTLKEALSACGQTPDVAFTLGDISFKDLIFIRKTVAPVPVYGVCGNHDDRATLGCASIPSIHGRVVNCGGFLFAGFEGSVRYKRGAYMMYSQKESLDIADSLPPADILISHDRAFAGAAPDMTAKFTNDPHEGLAGITAYLAKTSPLLHIHGHVHENKRYEFHGIDTLSVFGTGLLTIAAGKVVNYQVLL